MASKLPLIRLIRQTLLGSGIAATGSLLTMAAELILRHMRESSNNSRTASLIAVSFIFAPTLFGAIFSFVRSSQIEKGLKASRWPEDDLRHAILYTESPRLHRLNKIYAWTCIPIGLAWLIYCIASLSRPHSNPGSMLTLLLMMSAGQLSQLRQKLRQALPSPHQNPRTSPKPIHSEHWGQPSNASSADASAHL
ncbi:MAG TPA: hypothetical protein VGU46_10260 [Acidobacteriaceae bacterium]|nr:hypothetical protein [Acidobacteriaceae bacterium]